MDRRVVAVGLTIIMMAVIITMLKIYIPTGQQAVSTLVSPTPSPTWQFNSTSSRTTPKSAQVLGSDPETTRQPTSTPSPEMLRHGQYLFYSMGCFYCHGIKADGDEGPPIARVGLSLEVVINQVYRPMNVMPAFSPTLVSESDIAAIYAYLQSLKRIPRPQITTDNPDLATGEALYQFFGCFGCHGYRGEGGFGPRLVATPLTMEEVRNQIRNPRARMPAFSPVQISNEELIHIYAFLQSLTIYGETN